MNFEEFYKKWQEDHPDLVEWQKHTLQQDLDPIEIAPFTGGPATPYVEEGESYQEAIQKIWDGVSAAEYHALPQKFVVGMQGPDGEWTDGIKLTEDDLDDIKWGDDTLKWDFKNPPMTVTGKLDEYFKNGGSFTQDDIESYINQYKTTTKQFLMQQYKSAAAPDGERLSREVRKKMPGLDADVVCPEECKSFSITQGMSEPMKGTVWSMIQHLNDLHKWDRERIADWLEESGNNPEFPVPEDD